MSSRHLRAGIAMAIVVAAVGAGLARPGDDHVTPTRRPAVAVATVTTIAAVQPKQRRAFAVLRMPSRAPAPAKQAAILRVLSASRPLGVNLSLAREVRTRVGEDAWVVPGDGFVCVVRDLTATAGCNTTRETIAHGMSLLETRPLAPRDHLLLGVVPDDVRRVRVVSDRGVVATVPVSRNVYAYRGPAPVRAVVQHTTKER
jgi:hypothetical protein